MGSYCLRELIAKCGKEESIDEIVLTHVGSLLLFDGLKELEAIRKLIVKLIEGLSRRR